MPDFDYAPLAQDVLGLITEFGRDVILRHVAPGAPADAAKPWKPDPAAADATDQTVRAVFGSVDRSKVDGTLVLATDSSALIPASGVTAPTPSADQIIDGASTYRIVRVDPIRPGPVTLAYNLTLRG